MPCFCDLVPMTGAFFQMWIAPEGKLFDFPKFLRMCCCLPKEFELKLNLEMCVVS